MYDLQAIDVQAIHAKMEEHVLRPRKLCVNANLVLMEAFVKMVNMQDVMTSTVISEEVK